jgi:hypothetical protein
VVFEVGGFLCCIHAELTRVQIFGNLHPLDLLRLSRVSKEFRDLLMHRSSISVWRSSLNNVVPDLPSCPPNMNEPQWISLVFDATCQVGLSNSLFRYILISL